MAIAVLEGGIPTPHDPATCDEPLCEACELAIDDAILDLVAGLRTERRSFFAQMRVPAVVSRWSLHQ
jgi:hypothetical protein